MLNKIKFYILFLLLLSLTNCNTVTATARGIYKDIKTTHHYTTCVFTKTQCGDLDLD